MMKNSEIRHAPWPDGHRIDPRMAKDDVVRAIDGKLWHLKEWQALRVAANLSDERSDTPESYRAFLKRSKAGFWTPENVLFWKLIVTTQRFYLEQAPGPGSF
jgi:hypothetical protein